MEWKHDDLARDLKGYLSGNTEARMIWTDMQLGPSGSPRPDVYCIPRSYSKFAPIAYEVKVSRSDFLADVTAGKWIKYYAFASTVIFACPDGLLKTTDIPDKAGLIVRKAQVWRLAKRPTVQALDNLHRSTWLKLLMDGLGYLDRPRPELNRRALEDRVFKKQFGEKVARLLREREHLEWAIEDEIKRQEKALADLCVRHSQDRSRAAEKDKFAGGEYAKLCEMFGLSPHVPPHHLSNAIAAAIRQLNADERVRDLTATIEQAERALAAARLRITVPESEAA